MADEMLIAPPPTPIDGVPSQSQAPTPNTIRIKLERPTIGRKGPTPPPHVPARKALPEFDLPSDSDDEDISPSSCSSSGSESDSPCKQKKKKSKKKKSGKRTSSPSPSPPPKKSRHANSHMERDAKLVAALPFMQFLQLRQTPKACGRCVECKKPPCGVCKACVQNAKADQVKGQKDRRRCEMLKCFKDLADRQLVMPTGVPDTKEALTQEIEAISSELAEISVKRGQPDFDERRYNQLIDRNHLLREGITIIKNRKARRRARFPVGFHDVWGVLSGLEEQRIKNAKFVVRTGSSDECRTVELKRDIRDYIETKQLELAGMYSQYLCPFEEKEAFLIELKKDRV